MDSIKKIFEYIKLLNTRSFWVGFSAGLFYFSWVFWWCWALYPLESLGIESKSAAFILLLFVFLSSVFISAIWWGLFGFFTVRLFKNPIPSFLPAPAIAGAFTLTEYTRSIFFSVFWSGSGGVIGPHWPIGNLAYLFVDLRFVAITASVWGIYGITFLIAMLAATFIFIILKINLKATILEIFVLLIILAGANLLVQISDKSRGDLEPIKIAIIQTNTPSEGFNNAEESLEDTKTKLVLLKKAAEEIKEGIIVFPEGTNMFQSLSQFLDASGVQKYFNNLSEKNILIVDSIRVLEDEKFKSRAVLIDSQDGALGFYDKQILTPGGEYLPYIVKLPLSIINPSLREQFKSYREYDSGSGSNIIVAGDKSIKLIVCSDLLSPSRVRRENADFNIIIGSFSIWKGSPIIISQTLAMSRFRAIENGKYTALSSNSGRSYIIDPLGKVEKITSPSSYKLLTGSVIPNKNRTWYNYVGDWPILLLSSVVFWLGVKKIRDDKTS